MDKLSLNGINARKGKDSIVSINLLVEVNDTEELKILMKKLKAIPGVESIYRMTN
ncbi:ACT domain-containing protein [Clostridioides difficile]|nr:ACT domain-containing protein [Clostridioides difficile]